MKRAFAMTIVVLLMAITVWTGSAAVAKAVITDETIRQIFKGSSQVRDAHSVMISAGPQLHAMLQGFLTGDLAPVVLAASAMDRELGDMLPSVSVESKDQAEVWRILSDIKTYVQAVREASVAGDYKLAYTNYMKTTHQCVECHQVVRSWGVMHLPKPKEEQPKEEKPKEEKTKEQSKK